MPQDASVADPVLDQIDADLDAALARLMDLLRIQSVSTDPAYAADCDRAADWLVADLKSLGVAAEKRPTPGHPMVVGHIDGPEDAPEGAPHLMFYGHYDVQPIDPIELWDSPPFEPQIEDTAKGQVIRGRGSSDDKGQLMTFVEACRAWKAVHGALPCKITFFFEGEEESGSPSLVPFLKEHQAEFSAPDIALICDTGLFESAVPAITTQLRGMLAEDFTITGPSRDLHSGMYGGIAMNPIRVLTKILSGLHDDEGRITLPGFYDGVDEMSDEVRSQWQRLGFDHGQYLGDVGLKEPAGEVGRTPLEQIWSRPTCDVNGIWGGYTGDGFKTVIPSQASAKVSFRLVGRQDPDAIRSAFRAYLEGALPDAFTVAYRTEKGAPATQMPITDPMFETARQALSDEWPRPAAYVGCGGSIPIAGYFKEILGVDSMLIGFGRDDDQIHSPNEKYNIESFHKGARSWARILGALCSGRA
jgi:acetylornithine deacetylase/succinyl-diaminopimelate desuccinylase-like protein